MPTFEKCGSDVRAMAQKLLVNHQAVADRGVRIDLLFAFGERDETTGELKGHALKKGGVRALGICKVVSLKDRTKGMGDVEITLDYDHWATLDERDQEALLDHELHHIVVSADSDQLGRPKIKMRKHDFEVGWFKVIAERHGAHSVEQQQARFVFDHAGQAFFPFAKTEHDSGEVLARALRKAA